MLKFVILGAKYFEEFVVENQNKYGLILFCILLRPPVHFY